METKRYCGHCLIEVGETSRECPGCGSELPAIDPARPPEATASSAPSASLSPGTVSDYDTRQRDDSSPQGEGGDALGEFDTISPESSREVSETWHVGQRVARRFRLSHCIGQGGMGKVFLARDEILGRPIALKRVPQEIIFDSDARDDLRQEANRLLDLAHENIIRVHTYYDEPDWPFFAMEYLEGPTLKKLLNARKREDRLFSVEEVEIIARQVGRGLEYAHRKQLIHRDLKPANLMLVTPPGVNVTEDDTLKITDFGISRVIADSTLRQTGKRSGTLPYMSPEQFRGEECTVASDIYSLAATYYELLSGRPPFYTGDIGYQILNLPPKPIAGVPRAVNGVLLRALSKSPRHRFATVEEFTTALQRRPALAGLTVMTLFVRRAATRIAAGVFLLFLLFLAGLGVRSLLDNGIPAAPEVPGVAAPVPEGSKLDHHDLARVLQGQLDSQISFLETSKTAISFRVRMEKELREFPDVFAGIRFALDPETDNRIIRGELLADGETREFRIENLVEGPHLVRAFFDESVGAQVSMSAPLDIEKSFTVDLTGPEFAVEAFRKGSFVELGSGPGLAVGENSSEEVTSYSTFRDECSLRLAATEAAAIAAALYQVVTPGREGQLQQGSEFPIDNPLKWDVSLVEGQNIFLVYALDQLGNASEKKRVQITRLRLSISEFSVDRPSLSGNRVAVEGTLNAEGNRHPLLHFFVNDNRDFDAVNEYGQPTRDFPHFRTSLTLPRYSNDIEVRYEWGGEIFAFSPDVKISGVEVAAPEISLDPLPPLRTNQTSLNLTGTVDPYFDGLKVTLNQKGGTRRALTLRPLAGDQPVTAAFQETVLLSSNKTNEIEFLCHYDGQSLELDLSPVKVYCDTNDPELLEISFTQRGQYLHVRMIPMEPLSLLQIRQGDDVDWQPLLIEPNGFYLHITEIPEKGTTFTIELTDTVGNISQVEEISAVFVDAVARAGEGERGVVPGMQRDGEEPAFTGTSIREPRAVLRTLGLEFKAYGARGEEMGVTEVSQRAWHRYLAVTTSWTGGPGLIELPAVIDSEYGAEYLLGFAEWLTDELNDGYLYYVPTPVQWREAFMGSKDSTVAARLIEGWFQGDYPGWRFKPRPKTRYGINFVLPRGSRKENQTVTGLLDMESNLQEIVRGPGRRWSVIGGWNTQRGFELRASCLVERELKPSLKDFRQKFTGFRIGRRLAADAAPK